MHHFRPFYQTYWEKKKKMLECDLTRTCCFMLALQDHGTLGNILESLRVSSGMLDLVLL